VKKCTDQDFLGEWINTIHSKIGSSLVGVYATSKTSLVENFKHGLKKNYMVVNMVTFFR
jgi:hypothetical protein